MKFHIVDAASPMTRDALRSPYAIQGDCVILMPIYAFPNFAAWWHFNEKNWQWLKRDECNLPDDWATESYYGDFVYHYRQAWKDGEAYLFHVHLYCGALIGDVSLHVVDRGKAIIGYGIGQEYTGQGYGNEAVKLACDFAFNRLKLRRLEAWCAPDNERSIRLLRHFGFTECELFKKRDIGNGIERNQVLWSKIRT